MTPVTDEKLMAYADSELTAGETAALDALLAQDAQLRARLAPFIITRDRLATAFEHTLHEPVPDRLVAAIWNAPAASRNGAGASRKGPATRAAMDLPFESLLRAIGSALFPNGPTLATAFSAAAVLAIGVGTGWIAARSTEAPDLIVADGTGLTASDDLAGALETHASGATADVGGGRTIRPVQSFRTADKGLCREYVVTAGTGPDFAGVACKTPSGAWRLAIHVATAKALEAGGPYATAGRPSAPAVDALVNAMMSGDALGRDDEGALLRDGWRTAPPAGTKPEHGP